MQQRDLRQDAYRCRFSVEGRRLVRDRFQEQRRQARAQERRAERGYGQLREQDRSRGGEQKRQQGRRQDRSPAGRGRGAGRHGKRSQSGMKKYLITGLLIWIPLVITIWV